MCNFWKAYISKDNTANTTVLNCLRRAKGSKNTIFWGSKKINSSCSGSDFFAWQFQVNVLEPHPHLPILATSGLDNDVKIFYPTNTGEVDAKEIEKVSKFYLDKIWKATKNPEIYILL